jgi:AcrR family transcriptional regulator
VFVSRLYDWDEIRTFYRSGATMLECQRRFGFSNGAWATAVARGDIHPRPRHPHNGRRREQVADLLAEGMRLSDIARELGVSKATISYHARKLGLPPVRAFAQRYDWEAVQRYYDEGHDLVACIARFGFCRASWSQAVERGDIVSRPRALPIERFLVAGSTASRQNLKRRLIAAELKIGACEVCGVSRWRGRSLSLELHHRNGVRDDNRLDNLQILCPNCHSQTQSWGGRNRGGRTSTVA